MATVKKLNSTYTIDTTDVIVTGNLTVQGATTSITTTNTNISDNIIVLNSGETGNGVTQSFSGIAVDRGSLGNVSILYNELIDSWVLTNDGVVFGNISTTTGPGTALTRVEQDTSPALGGNLDVKGFEIFSSTNNVAIDGNLQINNTAVVPGSIAGATVLYTSVPAGGGSGVFLVNDTVANDELVSKTRAFGFSLIL